MSKTVDERVVKMEFDNSEFDKNIDASKKSLDNFNDYLNKSAKDSGGYFENLGDSANKIKFDGLIDSVQNISSHFNAFGVIAKTVLEDITHSLVQTGEQFAKSLTVEDIASGWNKYEQKTAGVMTIMAATGKSVDDVNASLEKLNWYTDETSYNFTDMVNNIGKFTAAGVDLDDAVSAMTGIGNVASVSGQGIQQASHAMYNFAQAMGAGVVKLIDWKSIQNANMETLEFKQTIIDTALELGTISEVADGVYKTLDGHEFTATTFVDQLKDGWFTGDVLIKTLKKYSAYSDEIYKIAGNFDTCSEAMDNFNGKGMELGEKAFRAAQEAKSFSEAIGAVHDAVSTGWMQTFEYLFGNYEESKKMWTDLANNLWDLFASPGVARNEFLADVMTSKWDQVTKAVVRTGVVTDDLNDKVFSVINTILEDNWYEEMAKWAVDGMMPQYESLEELRKELEFNGKTIEDYINETGSLQDALIEAGVNAPAVMREAVEALTYEAEKAAYQVGDTDKAFTKFSNTVLELKKSGKSTTEILSELDKAGYGTNISMSDINKIVAGTVTSFDQLSISTRKSVGYQDYANKAFNKFVKEAKEAVKEGKTTAEIYDILSEKGYDLSQNKQLLNKVINDEIQSYNDLTMSEQNAVIWIDEQESGLRKVRDGMYDVKSEIYQTMQSLYRKDARDTIVGALTRSLENLVNIVNAFRDAWDAVMPKLDADTVLDLAEGFADWLDSLALNEEQLGKLQNTFEGFLTIFKIAGKIIGDLLIPVKDLIGRFSDVNISVLDVTSSMADGIKEFDKWLDDSDGLATFMTKVSDAIQKVLDKLDEFIGRIKTYVGNGADPLQALKTSILMLMYGANDGADELDQGALDKVGHVFGNFALMLLDALIWLSDAVTKYWPKVLEFLTTLIDFVAEAFANFDWEKAGKKLLAFPKAILQFIKTMSGHGESDWRTAYPGLAAFVDGIKETHKISVEKAKKVFDKLKEVLGSFIGWIKEKFGDMTPENMAVLAFSAALIYTIIKIGKLAGSATDFVDNIVDFGKNIKDGFSNLGKNIKEAFGKTVGSEIQKIGLTLALLMGLVLAMTQFETKDLMKGVAVIGALGGMILAMALVLKLLSKIGEEDKKKVVSVRGVADLLVGFCAGILLVALAAKAVQDVMFTTDLFSTMIMVTSIVALMSALAAFMSKNAGSFGKSIGIALVLLVMSTSIGKVVDAMAKLAVTDIGDAMANLEAIAVVMLAFGALTMMAKGIKLSSALGLVVIISIIGLLMETMGDTLQGIDLSSSGVYIGAAVALVAIIMAFDIAMAKLAKEGGKFNGIASSMIGIAVSFTIFGAALAIIFAVIENNQDTWVGGLAVLSSFFVFTTALMFISTLMDRKVDGKAFRRGATAMTSVAGGILILVAAFALLNKVIDGDKTPKSIVATTAILSLLLVMTGALIFVSQYSEKANVKAIVAMLVSIGIIMSALAIMYNLQPRRLLSTARSITLIIMALSVMILSASNANFQSSGLISLAGMLLVLTGTLFMLESIPDVKKLITVTVMLVTLLGALTGMIYIIDKNSSEFAKAGKAMLYISATILALGVVVGALGYLVTSGAVDINDMAAIVVGLTIGLIALGAALMVVNMMSKDAQDAAKSLIYVSAAVMLMGLAIGTINALTSETSNMEETIFAMMAAMLVLVAGLVAINKFGASQAKVSASVIASIAVTVALIGVLFGVVAKLNLNWDRIIAICGGVALALVALGFVLSHVKILITRIESVSKNVQKTPTDFAGIAKAILAATAAVAAMTILITMLNRIDFDSARLITMAAAMGTLMVAIGIAMMLASKSGRNAKKAIGPLITMTAAVGIIGGFLIAFNKLNIKSDELIKNATVIGGFLLTMAGCLALIGAFNDLDETYAPLFTMTLAVGLIGGLLIALSAINADPASLASYAGSIGGVLITLALSMIAICKFSQFTVGSEKVLYGMVACVAVIGGVLIALSAIDGNTTNAATAAIGIGVCMLLFAASMKSLSKSYFYIQNGSKAIGLMAATMAVTGTVIALIAKMSDSAGEAMAAGVSVGLALYLVSKALATISLYSGGISKALPAIGVMSAAMVAAGVAISLVAAFAGDNWETLIAAALGIGLTLAVSALALSLVANNVAGMKDAAGSIAIVMGAVLVAATALAIIGKFCGTDFMGLGVAAIGIGAVLLAAAMSLAVMSRVSKDIGSVASSIGAMIGAILAASVALVILSKFTDPDSAIQGAIGLAVTMMAASVALLIASEAGANAISGAAAMALMSVALLATATALSSLAGYDWKNLIGAAASLAVVVVLMAVSAMIANNAVAGAAAMVVLSLAVLGISGALAALASMDTKSLITAAVTIAAFMLVLTLVGYLAEGASIGIAVIVGAIQGLSTAMLLIGVASIAFGAGMTLIAVSCEKLANVDMDKVAAGMIKLAVALPMMMAAFSASLIQNSTIFLELIITVLEMIIQTIYEITPKLIEVVIYICQSLIDAGIALIPEFIDFVTILFNKIIDSLRLILPNLILLVQETLINVIAAIRTVIPQLVECGLEIVDKLLQSIAKHMPTIVQSGCDIITSIIQGIADSLPEIIQAGVNLVVNLINGIAEASGQIVEAGFDLIISFIQGIADTLTNKENQEQAKTAMKGLIEGLLEMAFAVLTGAGEGLIQAGKDLLSSLWSGIKEKWTQVVNWFKVKFGWDDPESPLYKLKNVVGSFEESGKNICEGLWNGIKSVWDTIVKGFEDLGKACKNAWDSFWGIESPSKEMKKDGIYIVQGAVNGINEEAPHAVDAMVDAANDMYDAFEGESRDLAQQVADDLSGGIVIRPVMDLSEVEAGADDINGMFDDMQLNFDNVNFGGSTTANIAGKVATNRANAVDNQNGIDGAMNGAAGGVTFNQYNTSPKALSRYEIYRQTNNQLEMMKGLVAY